LKNIFLNGLNHQLILPLLCTIIRILTHLAEAVFASLRLIDGCKIASSGVRPEQEQDQDHRSGGPEISLHRACCHCVLMWVLLLLWLLLSLFLLLRAQLFCASPTECIWIRFPHPCDFAPAIPNPNFTSLASICVSKQQHCSFTFDSWFWTRTWRLCDRTR